MLLKLLFLNLKVQIFTLGILSVLLRWVLHEGSYSLQSLELQGMYEGVKVLKRSLDMQDF